MKIAEIFDHQEVPAWCADIEEKSLKIVGENNGSIYLLDLMSPYPMKKGFFGASQFVFRFKYLTPSGRYFLFLALEAKVPHANPRTLRVEEVPGLHILRCVTVNDDELSEHSWRDDMLPFQGEADPMQRLARAAKDNALAIPPRYFAEVA